MRILLAHTSLSGNTRDVARAIHARCEEMGHAVTWIDADIQTLAKACPDGAEHENTVRARKFARQLRGRFRLPVYEVDERYSTTEAHSAGAADADAASAAIILEQFLRNLP